MLDCRYIPLSRRAPKELDTAPLLSSIASFGGWFWTALAIMTPWNFCFICLIVLRKGVRNGRNGRDFCLNVSVWVEMVMLSAYGMLAPEIHRLTSLGVLK